MTSHLQAILFDLDGTVIDSEEVHRRAYNQTFMEFGLTWDWTPDVYADLLALSGGEARLASHIDGLDAPGGEKERLRRLLPAIRREKTRLYGELMRASVAKPRSGVLRLVREARAAGVKVGFAATSAADNVQTILEAVFKSQAARFDAVVSAALVENKKPAPDIYVLLLSMLGVRADGCVAIEDSANGVAAAKAAGLFTIATPTRWTRRQDLSAADLLLPELGEPGRPVSPESRAAMGGADHVSLSGLQRMLSSPAPA